MKQKGNLVPEECYSVLHAISIQYNISCLYHASISSYFSLLIFKCKVLFVNVM